MFKELAGKNIAIIDADLIDGGTNFPNLALMKISGYLKEIGCKVTLIDNYLEIDSYDHTFLARVFTKTKIPEYVLSKPNVTKGGSGFGFPREQSGWLPPEIEHHMPDYHLYDEHVTRMRAKGWSPTKLKFYTDFSIGFTTRGCFRRCKFCINQQYGRAERASPVSEFYDPSRPFIALLDDNVFAFPHWKEIWAELKATNRRFTYRQGLDIRIMTDDKGKAIAEALYYDRLIFAFDHWKDADLIDRNIAKLRKHTGKRAMFYVLCGYESTDINDIEIIFKRLDILTKYRAYPYIMRFEKAYNCELADIYTLIANWCNRPNYYTKKSFYDYCVEKGMSEKWLAAHKDNPDPNLYLAEGGKKGKAWLVIEAFKEKYPEVFSKYMTKRYDAGTAERGISDVVQDV
jgi:hypothetical protein